MTSARSVKIDLAATPYYHCMTRCVRRTYLCGQDNQTGRDYSHRKGWIVERIKYLTQLFAINICAYAIMSNHYHLVLYVNQAATATWDNEEVLRRWQMLFPKDAEQFLSQMLSDIEVEQKIALWRERLGSISWFMRCLNETIARLSNKEEELTGRFWEGRFKSQALLDEGAVLAAMAYVDLNPIRAKVADTPEGSEFTSIYERIQAISSQSKEVDYDNAQQPPDLMEFANSLPKNPLSEYDIPKIDFKLSDYFQLVDETGRVLRQGKRGAIPAHLLPILTRLNFSPKGWLEIVRELEKNFFHAIGYKSSLGTYSCAFRKRKPRGMHASERCYLESA